MNKDDLKISQAEFDKTKISRLADRPNVGTAFGGQALSAQQLKERYDAAPALIRERFNKLIDKMAGFDENGNPEGGVADLILTGLAQGYTMADLLAGFRDGTAMQYIKAGVDREGFEEYTVKGYLQYLTRELGEKLEAANVDAKAHRLDSNQDPTVKVTMTGEGEDTKVVFDFGVPEGEKGECGGMNGTNCEVISANATAGGNETIAGCKGFRIEKYSKASDYGGWYTLKNYSGGYEAGQPHTGDRVSICITKEDGNEYIYDNIGYIRSIDGNKVYVTNVDEDGNGGILADDISVLPIANPIEDQNTLWVVSKPNVGDVDIGVCAMAVGDNTRAIGGYSNAEGRATEALGKYAHTEGVGTSANFAAHGEGRFTRAKGQHAHSEGYNTEAAGDGAHSEGGNTKASGARSHSEGNGTTASGGRAHAEGENTKASAKAAHSEGNGTEASAEAAHSEGVTTKATARAAHSEGKNSTANGEQSHAEGDNTTTGVNARGGHSEGINTQANGLASHADGYNTQANGQMSHASGDSTIAAGARQTVVGKYNKIDSSGQYAFIVGNGTSDSARSNAFAVDWSGNIYLGDVKITPAQLQKLLNLI